MLRAFLMQAARDGAVSVRSFLIVAVVSALFAAPAGAAEEKKPCIGLNHEARKVEGPTAQAKPPLMTENECEAVKRHQLQMRLLEIPQEDEDPMGLSVGSQEKGGMLYFKIPFSF